MRTYRGDDATFRQAGTRAAATALRGGRLVVAPADFHYAVLADAFSPVGTARLRTARGVADGVAIPVFIDKRVTLQALFARVSPEADALARAFWPGPLTLVGTPQMSLAWDSGSADAVAVRMPLHPWMLELVAAVGPLAATGAQLPGQAPAVSLAECGTDEVSVGLDAGALRGGPVSSLVDLRGPVPVLIREAAISAERLRTVVPDLQA